MLNFSQLLTAIGAAVHLDTAAAAADGGCTLSFDGKLDITFELSKDQQSVYVFAPVLHLPAAGTVRETVLQTLLQIHLFGVATNGSYFGTDPQLNRVILFKTLELKHLDEAAALTSIEGFVNDVERWQRALLDLVLRVQPPAGAGTGGATSPSLSMAISQRA